MDEF
jgi:P4 family phage/plasmid primase-like protien